MDTISFFSNKFRSKQYFWSPKSFIPNGNDLMIQIEMIILYKNVKNICIEIQPSGTCCAEDCG